ncbi:MAG: hypothetical protein M1814_005034 [Vezdaea aestivalis]|nr:MAG: hypothetical protein M1814_005034 [Vezdaea aestivalis]
MSGFVPLKDLDLSRSFTSLSQTMAPGVAQGRSDRPVFGMEQQSSQTDAMVLGDIENSSALAVTDPELARKRAGRSRKQLPSDVEFENKRELCLRRTGRIHWDEKRWSQGKNARGLLYDYCLIHPEFSLSYAYKTCPHTNLVAGSLDFLGTTMFVRGDGIVVEYPTAEDYDCAPKWFKDEANARAFVAEALLSNMPVIDESEPSEIYTAEPKNNGRGCEMIRSESHYGANSFKETPYKVGPINKAYKLEGFNAVGALHERCARRKGHVVFDFEQNTSFPGNPQKIFAHVTFPSPNGEHGRATVKSRFSYLNKASAKKDAAAEALVWMDQNEAPPFKGNLRPSKKASALLEAPPQPAKAQPAQVTQRQLPPSNHSAPSANAASDSSPRKINYIREVFNLSRQLGLTEPIYNFTRVDTHTGEHLLSGGAQFEAYEVVGPSASLLRGLVGEVRSVHGTQAARQMSAQLVLAQLERVRDARLKGFPSGPSGRPQQIDSAPRGPAPSTSASAAAAVAPIAVGEGPVDEVADFLSRLDQTMKERKKG